MERSAASEGHTEDCVYTVLLEGLESGIIRSDNFNAGKIFSIIRTDPKYEIKVLGILGGAP